MCFRGFTSFFVYYMLFNMNKFSDRAGVSPAIIQSIVAYSTFLSAVIFYLLYGEKMNIQHYIGMVLIIIGIVFIAYQKSYSNVMIEIEETERVSVIIPILIALEQGFNFAVNSLICRIFVRKGFSPFQYCSDFLIGNAIIGIVLFLYEVNYGVAYTSI